MPSHRAGLAARRGVTGVIGALLLLLLCASLASAAITRDQAQRAARNVPMVRDALNLIPDARTVVSPPSDATGGAWLVQFGVKDPAVAPLLSVRVHAETGDVLGVACDTNAFRLRKAEDYPLWPADQLAGVRTETARDIVRAIGDAPDLRPYFAEHRKAQLRVDYAPDARRWIGYVHEGTKFLGYVTYADGAIRDVHLIGLNWTPSAPPPQPVLGLERLLPQLGAGAALLVALATALLVFMDPARPFGPATWRTLALYAFFAVALVFNVSPTFFAVEMAVVLWLFALAIRSAGDRAIGGKPSSLPRALLFLVAGAACVLALCGLWTGEVDDSSRCGGIGARHLLKEGRLPYGENISATGDMARDRNTYAPLFYVVHLPAETLAPTTYQREGVRLTVGEAGWRDFFDRRTMRETASRVTVTFFLVALLSGVGLLGWRAGGWPAALAWVAVCALGPPFLGAECPGRIIPTAFLVWAFLFLNRPAVAGTLLGLSAGSFFVAAFAIPLWLGWYWRKRRGAAPFLIAVAVVGFATLGLVVLCSNAPGPVDALRVFIKETVGFQEGAQGMAGRDWGFWASFPGLRAWLQGPVTVLFALFCLALAFRPRVTGERALIALTAAVLVGIEFWKSFGPGYPHWYFYLLVPALFWPQPPAQEALRASSDPG